ncbi:MAG: A24 family peptidase [Candidatus Diapherotrites archaeon]|nr:A24 family peptidase [Candidatus Diapherotrites archaeon]
MIQLVQSGALLIGTLAGAITDAKSGYIYDWITVPMILFGALISIFFGQWNNLLVGAAVFAALYISYWLGKIGGGDVKIFTAIALLNPFNNYGFFFGAAFFAAMSSIVFYSVYYTLKYSKKGVDFEENKEGIVQAILLGIFLAAYFVAAIKFGLFGKTVVFMLGFPLFCGLIFFALQKGIKKNFFRKKVPLKNLEEDEIISTEGNSEKILKIFMVKGVMKKGVIGEKEIAKLKKMKIKNIYVLRGLPPFGPFIFAGVAIALLAPDFFTLLSA